MMNYRNLTHVYHETCLSDEIKRTETRDFVTSCILANFINLINQLTRLSF